MKKLTVKAVVETNLCISCGVCKNVCMHKAITYVRNNGMYHPQINEEKCTRCGVCADVCPGLGFDYAEGGAPIEAARGKHISSFNAWSKNENIRHKSASGGIVSTIVSQLLLIGKYDCVFSVGSYDYSTQLSTTKVTSSDIGQDIAETKYPKSRYLPVSHENAVSFILGNRDARVIIIATSCAVRGLLSVIEKFKLDRDNYLFVGLFCERVFNYNVYDYYRSDRFCNGKQLEELHFKNKESGGWPGNMKFMFSDGTFAYHDKNNRAGMKDYFMPERCLYCIDKLNTQADISLGDNYTERDDSPLGSNSVVLRTQRGVEAWNLCKELLEYVCVDFDLIDKAQYLEGRINNLYFAALKEAKCKRIKINRGLSPAGSPKEYFRAYSLSLSWLRAGAVYHDRPQRLSKVMLNRSKPLSFTKRAYFKLRRMLSK